MLIMVQTTVLFNPKLNFALESIQRDQNGRVVILSIVLDGNNFVLANVYLLTIKMHCTVSMPMSPPCYTYLLMRILSWEVTSIVV